MPTPQPNNQSKLLTIAAAFAKFVDEADKAHVQTPPSGIPPQPQPPDKPQQKEPLCR
ncbi:MAG: hypothetical protein FWD96_02715 [Defluviitaleaceae bacterium]|nr:hypothetical protein [Defluviitaleaceae bacterium]